MRIISESHDYYDCVQSQGQDRTCTWVRGIEDFQFGGWDFPKIHMYTGDWDQICIEQIIVGFCGKIYPILKVKKTLCYTMDEIVECIRSKVTKLQYEDFQKNRYRKTYIGLVRRHLLEFYEECRQKQTAYADVFVENGCPVFVAEYQPFDAGQNNSMIRFHGRKDQEAKVYLPRVTDLQKCRRRFVSDRMLKDYGFYKLFPTQTAFQEIHMYLGGVLGFSNPHVPVPDDKTMRDIKGFDKWSFKKEPKT